VSGGPPEDEVALLRRELEETNRGLIALFAELETAREAEARLAAIVQSSDDAMFSVAPDRVIESWNPGAERLLGRPAAEVVGGAVEVTVPDALRPEHDAALERLRAGERSVSFDSWRRRGDGSVVEVAVTLSAMRGPGDRLIGYAAVLRDLTERKRAEAELAASRTAHEVLAARDRIARDLHDGAVQAIFGVGMRLQATATMCQDEVMRRRLESMVAQLDDVITDLRRHVFGVRAGAPGDLGTSLSAVAAEIADQRGMRVTADVDADVATRLGERGEDLVHVVREALSNASRHGGAATARVSLRREAGRAVLEVADDGCGFDVERATRPGHGLENFRWRAERLSGEVVVTSTPGGGTTVRLSLPV
jgi:PAS domain S-box-containing protein